MAKFTSKTEIDETAIFASSGGEAIHAQSTSAGVAAIAGIQVNQAPGSVGAGVYGESFGEGAGLVGINNVVAPPGNGGPIGAGGPGGYFRSEQKEAVFAETFSPVNAAIAAIQNNPNSTGAALYAKHITGGTAAYFQGNVIVTGDVSFPGADFAEDFTIEREALAEPGTVMAFNADGALVPCLEEYEKKVVGVIAGAGSYRTGIVMDKQFDANLRRQPVALVGKVFCKVDASYGAIEVGDLLTSSATQGHAMKATDPSKAFGSVLGKAMAPLTNGVGLIPILITLQ